MSRARRRADKNGGGGWFHEQAARGSNGSTQSNGEDVGDGMGEERVFKAVAGVEEAECQTKNSVEQCAGDDKRSTLSLQSRNMESHEENC